MNECHILRPKCTEFDFGSGAQPSPDPLAVFKGEWGRVRGRERRRKGRDRRDERKRAVKSVKSRVRKVAVAP